MRAAIWILAAACAEGPVREVTLPPAVDAPVVAIDAPPPAPDADTGDRARCLEIISNLVPLPELDTVRVYVPVGWSIAAGPWSRFNEDLATVEDVFRYEDAVGALTIFLHDGVVSCVFRTQVL